MSACPKSPRLELPKLRALARNAPCHLLIPGIHKAETGNVVWCHSNLLEHGHGAGLKSHDCFGCFGCFWCHFAIDHGKALTHEEKVHFMRKAMDRSLLYLWQNGHIGVL